jgi:hypothetical protein
MENVLIFVYILLVGATVIAALLLVTFSPVRQVRQPARSLLLGLGSTAVAVLSSIPLALFGSPSVWLWLVSIGVLTAGIGGVLMDFSVQRTESIQRQKTTLLQDVGTISGMGVIEVERCSRTNTDKGWLIDAAEYATFIEQVRCRNHERGPVKGHRLESL